MKIAEYQLINGIFSVAKTNLVAMVTMSSAEVHLVNHGVLICSCYCLIDTTDP